MATDTRHRVDNLQRLKQDQNIVRITKVIR